MAVCIVIGLFIAWWYAVAVAKEMHAQARDRRHDRIMAAYLQREDIRMHAWNLASIERVQRATAEEMVRVAAEANGEVIEGTCHEVEPR
jgi:hypothetical protein